MGRFKSGLLGLKICFVDHGKLVKKAFDVIEHYALKEPDTVEDEAKFYRTNYKPFDDNLNLIIPYLPKDNVEVWFQLGCIYNTFVNIEQSPKTNLFSGKIVSLDEEKKLQGVIVAPVTGYGFVYPGYLAIATFNRRILDEKFFIKHVENSIYQRLETIILNQNLLDYVHAHAEELNQTLKIIDSGSELCGRLWGFRYEGAENEKMQRDKIIPYSLSFGLSTKKISLEYYRVGFIVDRYGNVIHSEYPQSLRILPW